MMDYTIFGESHGPAVGVLLRDVPPGLPVDEEFICRQLLRRAPQDPLSTARHEPDQVEVLSGVYQGVTTGMPVCLLLPFGLSGFVSSLLGWSGCKRYLIRSNPS